MRDIVIRHHIFKNATGLASEANLHEAMATVDAMPAMGLVEEFSRLAHLLQEWLKPVSHHFKIVATTQNSTNRSGDIKEKTGIIIAEIKNKLYEKLPEYNELDIRLHKYSISMFEKLCDAFSKKKGC